MARLSGELPEMFDEFQILQISGNKRRAVSHSLGRTGQTSTEYGATHRVSRDYDRRFHSARRISYWVKPTARAINKYESIVPSGPVIIEKTKNPTHAFFMPGGPRMLTASRARPCPVGTWSGLLNSATDGTPPDPARGYAVGCKRLGQQRNSNILHL